jgi:hypothetical protein
MLLDHKSVISSLQTVSQTKASNSSLYVYDAFPLKIYITCQDSSFSIGYVLEGQGIVFNSCPTRARGISFVDMVQIGFVVHRTSYVMGTGGSFPDGKASWA